jgi:anti-sigma factor RsiW
MIMNQNHVLHQIPDYVLGLLPRQERVRVEQHTAVCPICQQQLHQENELSTMIRATLTVAAQPAALRLRQIMPAPSPIQQRWRFGQNWFSLNHWPRQLAVIAIFLALILGSVTLYQQQYSSHTIDSIAATATMIHEPTMTVASVNEEEKKEVVGTAVPAHIIEPTSTPAPAPTPIAALDSDQLSVNNIQYSVSSN